ncbi:putative Ca2+ sensor [Planoprotostelium fungivorum]|uniref:Putative Ca2+ sensor n=1 Tax=Planoprotostelium fungivorum TaxID=1890364 RepID=A0A2P6N6G1_9EUKA|nr:putative Ca2+ sensor [Planoprotostelium fungivorum]
MERVVGLQCYSETIFGCLVPDTSSTLGGMGCSNEKISKEEIEHIQQRAGRTIPVKDILHWKNVWLKIAPNGGISEDQFAQFVIEHKVGTGKDFDARSMFRMIDKDRNGVMEFEEFVLILLLPKAEDVTPEQFAMMCISIYDEDGDGMVTRDELLKFALAKAKAEGKTSPEEQEQITDIVSKLVLYIDTNSDGKLSREEIASAIHKDPYLKRILRQHLS